MNQGPPPKDHPVAVAKAAAVNAADAKQAAMDADAVKQAAVAAQAAAVMQAAAAKHAAKQASTKAAAVKQGAAAIRAAVATQDAEQATMQAAAAIKNAAAMLAAAKHASRVAAAAKNDTAMKRAARARRAAADKLALEQAGLLSSDWVESVASTREGDLRAHQIAYTYHRFARVLDEWIYDDVLDVELDIDPDLDPFPDDHSVWWSFERRRTVKVANVNWFGFATWATISINRDIRNQRPPLRSERVLPVSLRPWLSPTIMNIKASDGQRISRVLSWGQRLVFLSTTGAFLELLLNHDEDKVFEVTKNDKGDVEHPCTEKWANRVCELAQWDGLNVELQVKRHLQPVARGFECFRRARIASRQLHELPADAPKDERDRLRTVRARRVLMGNLLITAVEQDVVQRAVSTVIEHVPNWMSATVSARLARLAERYTGVSRRLAAKDIPTRLLSAREIATELWARVMTDQILVMMLPTETLRLGRDIPALRVGEPYFMKELADLTTLPGESRDTAGIVRAGGANDVPPDPRDRLVQALENDELVKVISAFDRSRANGAGTGASDWRRYDERMNWAVSLLRTRQRDHTLFWSPYSSEDGKRILDGLLPQRVGDPSAYEVIAPLEGAPIRN